VGIDWMTFSGPESRKGVLAAVVERFFGPIVETIRGRFFCRTAWKFERGAVIHFEHTDGVCILDLPGGVLSTLDGDGRVQVLRGVLEAMGFRCTRIDLAEDFIGSGLGLVGKFTESCRKRECIGNPVWDERHMMRAGELLSNSLTLGRKGSNGNGRQLCVYDKGLEQRTDGNGMFWKIGEWERVELRLYSERASQASMLLYHSLDWKQTIRELIYGSVEFREQNGAEHRARRPIVKWWADLLGTLQVVATSMGLRLTSLAGTVQWLRRQVAPLMRAMAEEAGQALGEFVETIAGDVRRSSRASAVASQFRLFVESGGDLSNLGPVLARA
jgi:DNA relaxase NicK